MIRKDLFKSLPLLLLTLAGCGEQHTSKTVPLTPDFGVTYVSDTWQSPQTHLDSQITNTSDRHSPREQCQERIEKTICVTNQTSQEILRNVGKIKCLPDNSRYVADAMSIYDELPEKMQPLFCSISYIYITDKLASVGLANVLYQKNRIVGGYFVLRKSVFDAPPSIPDVLTWKEQLIFGGSRNFLSNNPGLVQVRSDVILKKSKNMTLFYLFTHELAHFLDYKNKITREGSAWTNYSWNPMNIPNESARYSLQNQICFYNCFQYIGADKAHELYSSLKNSAFMTTYAGVNRYEDFAEFWTWYVIRRFKNSSHKVVIPEQGEIELDSIFTENPKIQDKMRMIEAIWNSPDLITE